MSNKGFATSKAKPVILDLSLPTLAATRVLVQDFSVAAMGFVNVVVVKAFGSPKLIGTDAFIHLDPVAGQATVVAVAGSSRIFHSTYLRATIQLFFEFNYS